MLKLKLQQFAAPGGTTALRADTFNKLQLNAGILLKNFDYKPTSSPPANATELKALIEGIKAGTTSGHGDIIGATRGGGSFTVSKETRTPEIDGMRYPFKGSDYVDSTDAALSTTLVEITPDNLKIALASGVNTATSTNVSTITMNTAIATTDYLTNICWVGDLADGDMVLICLNNAINTADLTFTYTDKGEGTLGVEFHARQAAVDDYDTAPFEVVFYNKAT